MLSSCFNVSKITCHCVCAICIPVVNFNFASYFLTSTTILFAVSLDRIPLLLVDPKTKAQGYRALGLKSIFVSIALKELVKVKWKLKYVYMEAFRALPTLHLEQYLLSISCLRRLLNLTTRCMHFGRPIRNFSAEMFLIILFFG